MEEKLIELLYDCFGINAFLKINWGENIETFVNKKGVKGVKFLLSMHDFSNYLEEEFPDEYKQIKSIVESEE